MSLALRSLNVYFQTFVACHCGVISTEFIRLNTIAHCARRKEYVSYSFTFHERKFVFEVVLSNVAR